MLQKLGPSEHENYCNFIVPNKISEIYFEETIELVCKMFRDQSSLFNTCWECLDLVKEEDEDLVSDAGIINKMSKKIIKLKK